MGMPAAKKGDRVVAVDTHQESMGPPMKKFPFNGVLNDNLSPNVNIMKKPAAIVGSQAVNLTPHVGIIDVTATTNKGKIQSGSSTVKINGKSAARNGDNALTCNYPTDIPIGKVIASGTVFIGG
jgi:uncharacterized Zn-binding protein involved in type VI secretion